jgi:hypothetical protein
MIRSRNVFALALALAVWTSAPAQTADPAKPAIVGWWKVTLEMEGRKSIAYVGFEPDLTGHWRSRTADSPLHDVKFEPDGKLSFHFFLESPQGKSRMDFQGTMVDEELLGTLQSPRSVHPVIGVRHVGPVKPAG